MRFASLAVLRTQSDERLVALARGGNEHAFEAIVERYRRPLLRHARRLLTATAAEDAVQQALLSSWTALRRGDDVRELSAWLHRILHNVALNALRDAGRGECVELSESVTAGNTPEDEIERRMAMRRTLAGMAALPEHQREAVLRMAVQGRSQADVAQALGLSHGAVGQLVLRARRTLRAAATTLTPQGLLQWLSSLGSEGQPAAARIAELAGGAGGGAVGLSLGKLAAIVAVAGTAATGPTLTDQRDDAARPRAPKPTELVLVEPERVSRDRPGTSRAPIEPSGRGGGETRGPSSGDRRSGSSGSGSGGSESSGPGSGGSESSGSGSLDSGSGTSGSGTSGSGTSGSGTSGSDYTTSGSSGSGSSGSGSSGTSNLDYSTSGSNGSGSSGSGSSGSGTSEPDSSGPGSGDPS